jgi:hypothetical protein
MHVQLDAAQVISLIDDCPLGRELRPLLARHICVIPASVLLDLRHKQDSPLVNFRRAFGGLRTIWALDAGMICRTELSANKDAFLQGLGPRSALAGGCLFRDTPLAALAVRAGMPVPAEFCSKSFADLFGEPLARTVLDFAAEAFGQKFLEDFASILEANLDFQPQSLAEPIGRTATQWGMADLAAGITREASSALLVEHFPANALMCQMWKTALADRKRRWTPNDVADVFQAASAPYCDAAFMDGKAAGRTKRAAAVLKLKLEVIANAKATDFLRSYSAN